MSQNSDIIANFFMPEIISHIEFFVGSFLISGFLIFFNLRRIQKIEFLEKLDKWEGSALIIILGLVVNFFSTMALSLSVVISISLLGADPFQLRDNVVYVLFLAYLFIPIRLFSKKIMQPLKENLDMIFFLLLELFAFVIWTQIFFIMPTFGVIIATFYWAYYHYKKRHYSQKESQ